MPYRIRSRHQPFEMAVLATAPVCGILLIVLDVRPQSVEMVMSRPLQAGWECSLIIVGVAGLLGALWPGRLSTGLGIELASLLMLGTVTGMYAVALTASSGLQAVAATSFVFALAFGSGWRAVQIMVDLRRLARPGEITPFTALTGGAASGGEP